jgi:hypothetical protein
MSKKIERIALGMGLWLFIGGCATNTIVRDEDRFYNLMFKSVPGGVINEFDTDGDGYGDLRLIYEAVGIGEDNIYLELRAIQEDKNRNHEYEESETRYVKRGEITTA